MNQSKIVYLEDAAAPGQRPHERWRDLALRRLPALLRHMLDNADDALFECASRALNGDQQSRYFAAMRHVRLRRSELEEVFRRELMAGFRSTVAGEASAAEPLEQAVAVRDMVAKHEARCRPSLDRLAEIARPRLKAGASAEEVLPFAPAQVVQAFATAATVLELDAEPRLLIYKLFDRHVMGQLPGLYEEALRQLGQETRPGSLVAPGADTFTLLAELLEDYKYGHGEAGRWTGTGYSGLQTAVDVTEVMAALSELQHSDGQDRRELKQALRQVLVRDGHRNKVLGRREDDTVDLVSMLFQAILGDASLPDSVKALLARLQIPMIKVALLDAQFFQRSDHPARALINELAQAAVGWSEPEDPEQDPVYRQIRSSVERVQQDFGRDPELIQVVLDEFRVFLRAERERVRRIEERTRHAAEGKAKVEDAKARVRQELNARTAGRQLPAVVEGLINEAWYKLLFITWLREGEGSADWQRQLAVVEQLVWSVQPKNSPEERKRLLQAIPRLLHDLREGLGTILFNPLQMTRLFKELEREHVRCLQTPLATGAPPPAPAANPRPPGDEAHPNDELSEYARELGRVRIGTWFEFRDAGGRAVRGKLAARLAGGDRLVFVNRGGFKLAERTVRQFAEELRQERVRVLDDNQLFDRALDTVLDRLRDLRDGR